MALPLLCTTTALTKVFTVSYEKPPGKGEPRAWGFDKAQDCDSLDIQVLSGALMCLDYGVAPFRRPESYSFNQVLVLPASRLDLFRILVETLLQQSRGPRRQLREMVNLPLSSVQIQGVSKKASTKRTSLSL